MRRQDLGPPWRIDGEALGTRLMQGAQGVDDIGHGTILRPTRRCRYRRPMRRLIELSRYVVAVPAIGSILGAITLMVIGTWDIIRSIIKLFDTSIPLKESVVTILTAVDTLLLATVLLVIGYGLYELFVDAGVQLPPWLEIRSLDDLKAKLIGVVVAIIAVVFLGVLVDNTDPNDVMLVGIGAGAVVIGLAAFTYATKKESKNSYQ